MSGTHLMAAAGNSKSIAAEALENNIMLRMYAPQKVRTHRAVTCRDLASLAAASDKASKLPKLYPGFLSSRSRAPARAEHVML